MTDETVAAGLEALKPCPFCGGTDLATWEVCSGGGQGVMCRTCHVSMDTRAEIESDAIAAWNTRAEAARDDAVRVEREAAAYLIDRYKRLWRGEVVRDLAEAIGVYEAAIRAKKEAGRE